MVPFLILAVINALLIYEVVYTKKNQIAPVASSEHRSTQNKSMTISVITFTVAFFILTGPMAFGGIFF